MTSQRFCLRWNNHQSNLLSVFDQLLHAETFTDVTLAVEGQYLKAHKMVLSACSPYFNALFVNHPEKHPIVILKDVPYADMKSLLDFMYRGEVSVDQERLTAFLRVAESLRIKGLTEVNDDKPMGPAITPPPPQLHRIQPYLVQQRKAVAAQAAAAQVAAQQAAAAQAAAAQAAAAQAAQAAAQQAAAQQAAAQSGILMNSPLLGSALSMPKRKRGRPRKLSGSSNGTGNDFDDYDRDNLVQGSPEMLEVKMGADLHSANDGSDDNNRDSGDNDHEQDSSQEPMDTSESINKPQSKDIPTRRDNDNSTSDIVSSSPELTQRLLGIKTDLDSKHPVLQKIRVNLTSSSQVAGANSNSCSGYSNSLLQQQLQNDSLNNNNNNNNTLSPQHRQSSDSTNSSNTHHHHQQQQQQQSQLTLRINTSISSSSAIVDFYKDNQGQNTRQQNIIEITDSPDSSNASGSISGSTNSSATGAGRIGGTVEPISPTFKQPQRRRVRRKASSTDDQAEHLTEMSVRGLDLFRYASITEGVYHCTECSKLNVQKTFKNKYSFQRHAFLYHEGKHRKVFPCPVCGKEFSRPDKMKNHMKTTHECYVPKEVNYHPLNYLISAAAAGEIQQMFPQLDNTTTNTSSIQGADNNSTDTYKINIKNENSIVAQSDSVDQSPPRNVIESIETGIAEEVK